MMVLHVKPGVSSEDFLARLTIAVYERILRFKKKGSRKDLENNLLNLFRSLMKEDIVFVDSSDFDYFAENEMIEPWSREAIMIEFIEDE